jgi:putative hemolysin
MEDVRATVQPFAIQPSAESAWVRAAIGIAAPAIERALGLTRLGRMYDEAIGPALVDDFPERALDYLQIAWRRPDSDLTGIPAAGPLVVVANHPFGAADGLVLLALVRSVRRDVRLLGNDVLERLPALRDLILPVDPFGGQRARAANRAVVRRAVDWVTRGGAVIVFPAGEVSSVAAPDGALIDGPWKQGAARIARDAGASVLPVYFDGRNSRGFEFAGKLHPRIRTAMLPRELLRMRGRTVSPVIGRPIDRETMEAMPDAGAASAYLRTRTYALRKRTRSAGSPRDLVPTEPAGATETIAREIGALGPARQLISHRRFSVFYATAPEAPAVVREIGRLREIAFRAAGEGTGKAIDLDEFDRHYWHLFLWDLERRQIAGAYRLGATDTITPRLGDPGLYTRTLFRYGKGLLRRLGPALELGRSFVRVEYQRDFGSLLLLWQGIGRFVARHPRYRRLFGPVSISADYSAASRDLMADLLNDPSIRSPLSRFVVPRRPYHRSTAGAASALAPLRDVVHRLVAEAEPDGKGLPVLVRQYLRLNARVLALSIDPGFSGVLDALVVVDLDQLDRVTLARYMGSDVDAFLDRTNVLKHFDSGSGPFSPVTPPARLPRL